MTQKSPKDFESMPRRCTAFRALICAALPFCLACKAHTTSIGDYNPPLIEGHAVTADEITLQSITTFGKVPVFSALTGYASDEPSAAQAAQVPLYAPYDSTDPAWWDNLVAEQAQARVRRISFPTRGVASLDAADLSGPGDMNPRRLSLWVDAVTRADAGRLFEAGCYVDMPFMQLVASALHSSKDDVPLDLSAQADWNDVFWLRAIKPWYDTVPSSFWYSLNDDTPGGRGPIVIELGRLDPARFTNAAGNASKLLSFIADQFRKAYGEDAVFVLDHSFFVQDPSVSKLAAVIGDRPQFSPPSTASAQQSYQGRNFGSAVAGFIDPSYDDPASASYHSSAAIIPRTTTAPDGSTTITLEDGLRASASPPSITLLQSFTDYDESAGFYRSLAWDFPSEYLNLVRRYGDLRTVTLRLEAEGADRFRDTTQGNSGGAFLRSGDLDVRALTGSGWAVTDTAPGESLTFENVDFSEGNYEFIIRYTSTDGASATPAPAKRVQIGVDDTRLLPAAVPGTEDANSFAAYYVGSATLTHGPHTLTLTFLDGKLDLDWLFVKKTDSLATFQTKGGTFVSAIGGGNGVLQGRIAKASIYENFSLNDLNGGTLQNGDHVSLQAYDGYYLTADPASGTLGATARAPDAGTTFTLVQVGAPDGGAPITNGEDVALLAADGTHYVTVGSDTTEQLDVTGTSIGVAQTFTLGLAPQSPQ